MNSYYIVLADIFQTIAIIVFIDAHAILASRKQFKLNPWVLLCCLSQLPCFPSKAFWDPIVDFLPKS